MTDKKTPDTKPSQPLVDMSKPIAVIFHQTATRPTFKIIEQKDCANGETVVEHATKIAAGIALNNSRQVAVFGPQAVVKIPPAEPKADDLALDFSDTKAAETDTAKK